MIRKVVFLISVLLVVFLTNVTVNAQILSGTDALDSTTVTVGTTTYDVEFAAPSFGDAETTIQNILFYLRNSFGFEQVEYEPNFFVQSTGTSSSISNVYNDIADIAFSTEERETPRAVAVSIAGTCHTFTESFDLGDSGPEVLELQRFLNQDPDTQVATEGVGSPGEETEFFGTLTDLAVRAFQRKYASEVLNPLQLFQPTGFWGASSRAKANELHGCGE